MSHTGRYKFGVPRQPRGSTSSSVSSSPHTLSVDGHFELNPRSSFLDLNSVPQPVPPPPPQKSELPKHVPESPVVEEKPKVLGLAMHYENGKPKLTKVRDETIELKAPPENRHLIISGLANGTTEEDIRSICEMCGNVHHVKILMDFKPVTITRAYVRMKEHNEAVEVIEELNGAELEDHELEVNWLLFTNEAMEGMFGKQEDKPSSPPKMPLNNGAKQNEDGAETPTYLRETPSDTSSSGDLAAEMVPPKDDIVSQIPPPPVSLVSKKSPQINSMKATPPDESEKPAPPAKSTDDESSEDMAWLDEENFAFAQCYVCESRYNFQDGLKCFLHEACCTGMRYMLRQGQQRCGIELKEVEEIAAKARIPTPPKIPAAPQKKSALPDDDDDDEDLGPDFMVLDSLADEPKTAVPLDNLPEHNQQSDRFKSWAQSRQKYISSDKRPPTKPPFDAHTKVGPGTGWKVRPQPPQHIHTKTLRSEPIPKLPELPTFGKKLETKKKPTEPKRDILERLEDHVSPEKKEQPPSDGTFKRIPRRPVEVEARPPSDRELRRTFGCKRCYVRLRNITKRDIKKYNRKLKRLRQAAVESSALPLKKRKIAFPEATADSADPPLFSAPLIKSELRKSEPSETPPVTPDSAGKSVKKSEVDKEKEKSKVDKVKKSESLPPKKSLEKVVMSEPTKEVVEKPPPSEDSSQSSLKSEPIENIFSLLPKPTEASKKKSTRRHLNSESSSSVGSLSTTTRSSDLEEKLKETFNSVISASKSKVKTKTSTKSSTKVVQSKKQKKTQKRKEHIVPKENDHSTKIPKKKEQSKDNEPLKKKKVKPDEPSTSTAESASAVHEAKEEPLTVEEQIAAYNLREVQIMVERLTDDQIINPVFYVTEIVFDTSMTIGGLCYSVSENCKSFSKNGCTNGRVNGCKIGSDQQLIGLSKSYADYMASIYTEPTEGLNVNSVKLRIIDTYEKLVGRPRRETKKPAFLRMWDKRADEVEDKKPQPKKKNILKGKTNKRSKEDVMLEEFFTEIKSNQETLLAKVKPSVLKVADVGKFLRKFNTHQTSAASPDVCDSLVDLSLRQGCSFRVRFDEESSTVQISPSQHMPFACVLCPYVTKFKSRLLSHLKGHQRRYVYRCDFCDFESISSAHISVHQTFHKQGNGNLIFYQENWHLHLMSSMSCCILISRLGFCHDDVLIAENNDDWKENKCHICYWEAADQLTFRAHMSGHVMRHRYSCERCGFSVMDKNMLASHTDVCCHY